MVLPNTKLFWIATVFLFFDFLSKILILSMLFKEFDKEIKSRGLVLKFISLETILSMSDIELNWLTNSSLLI